MLHLKKHPRKLNDMSLTHTHSKRILNHIIILGKNNSFISFYHKPSQFFPFDRTTVSSTLIDKKLWKQDMPL